MTLNIENLLNFFAVNGKLAKKNVDTEKSEKVNSVSSVLIPKKSHLEKS